MGCWVSMVICTVDEVDSFFNFHPNLQNILMEESLIKKPSYDGLLQELLMALA
jgi:hypothetical protein